VSALLRDYVSTRLAALRTGDLREAIARSEEIHGELWRAAAAAAEKDPRAITPGLFIQALNEVIDLHAERIWAYGDRVPVAIFYVLFVVAALGLGTMGFLAGLRRARDTVPIAVMMLLIPTVMLLILDLDRPQRGLIRVSNQALIDLRDTLAEPSP
jgi:hypothetical protein